MRKVALGLIESRTREAETAGGPSDRHFVLPDAPQHFVFDLDQILRIEKLFLQKHLVLNLLGSGIQSSALPERLDLALLGRVLSGCHMVNIITPTITLTASMF